MNRNWNDFKSLHTNIEGARASFEDACEKLYRRIYPKENVSQISVKQGDGGIDIYVGELGIEPITVIQCKFFLETFEESQKSQIRSSFDTAINSNVYELKEWILCIPRVIDIDESSWWHGWKAKKMQQYHKEKSFIKLVNGNELIDLFKEKKLYNDIFKIEEASKIDAIYKAVVPHKIESQEGADPRTVLFNNYSKKNESFYQVREIDIDFINSLKVNNIWIFGNSGKGKTVLINRNLSINDIEYCFCDMSPITITGIEEILEEIVIKAEDKFGLNRNETINNKIKQISNILSLANKNEVIIVIDELAVTDKNILKQIITTLHQLVVHYSNSNPEGNLKFIISTLFNPHTILSNNKASDYFQYLDCNDWNSDLANLFDILNKSLNLNLEYNDKINIISNCEGSPRILKSIIRKIVSFNSLDNNTIQKAILLTRSELV